MLVVPWGVSGKGQEPATSKISLGNPPWHSQKLRPSLHPQLPWLSVGTSTLPRLHPTAQVPLGTADTDTQHPSSFWGAQLLTQGLIRYFCYTACKARGWAPLSALPLRCKENTQSCLAREMLEHLCSENCLRAEVVQPGQEKFLRKP